MPAKLIPYPIGLSTGSFYPHAATEEAVEQIAALGFATCECYFQAHSEYQPAFHGHLATTLQRLSLAVHSVHTDTRYFEFFTPYARRRADAFALFTQAIEGTARIGARCLNWHGLTLGEAARGTTLSEAVEVVGILGERAQQHGVLLTLENVSWCAMRTAEDVRWWRSQRLPIGFCYDPFQAAEVVAEAEGHRGFTPHLALGMSSPALNSEGAERLRQAADPIAILQAMGADLATFHASDYRAEGPRHLPPGEGDLPWDALMTTLATLPYRGPIIIEPAHLAPGDHAALTASAAFLHRLTDKKRGALQ